MEAALFEGVTLIVDRYSYSGVAFSAAKGLDVEWCKVTGHPTVNPWLPLVTPGYSRVTFKLLSGSLVTLLSNGLVSISSRSISEPFLFTQQPLALGTVTLGSVLPL